MLRFNVHSRLLIRTNDNEPGDRYKRSHALSPPTELEQPTQEDRSSQTFKFLMHSGHAQQCLKACKTSATKGERAARLPCLDMMAGVVFGVAVAARLVHLWAIRGTPFFDVLMGDARSYDAWATATRRRRLDRHGRLLPGAALPVFPRVGSTRSSDAICSSSHLSRLIVGAASRPAGRGRRTALLAGASAGSPAWPGAVRTAIFFDALLQKSVLDVFFMCLTLWPRGRLIADTPAATGAWVGARTRGLGRSA